MLAAVLRPLIRALKAISQAFRRMGNALALVLFFGASMLVMWLYGDHGA